MCNSCELTQRHKHWADVSDEQWNDWHWQQREKVRSVDDLLEVADGDLSESEIEASRIGRGTFQIGITPYYFSLIDFSDPKDPIRLQSIPQIGETLNGVEELVDPHAEDTHTPVKSIMHRYPDRVLLYTSHNCPVYCRHCTRSRMVSDPNSAPDRSELGRAVNYLKEHSEVRDVLLSGGDPLTLSNGQLFGLIKQIQEIPHVEIVRLGTRNLVTLPQRFDEEFIEGLRELNNSKYNSSYKPVYINTHFNHPAEFTSEAIEASHKLRMAGSPLGNQAVLLRDVNDDVEVMRDLHKELVGAGIKPYYLYPCDSIPGTAHFKTPLEMGLEIVDGLRGHTSGFCTPQYIVDTPGGGGKVLLPNGITGRNVGETHTTWQLRNYEGRDLYFVAPNDETDYYDRNGLRAPPSFQRR